MQWTNLSCKIALLNVGVESFDKQYEYQIYNLLNKIEFITLRDIKSFEIIKQYDKLQKVFLGSDSTFLSPLLVKRHPQRNMIGISLCGAEVENYTNNYSIIEIINAINSLKNFGYKIVAVNFSHNDLYNDVQYGRMVDVRSEDKFSIGVYEKCDFFIGMRFHSILLALQNQIPCIAIAYSNKIKRLMSEYGLLEYCLEPQYVSNKTLTLLLKKLAKDKQNIVNTIRQGNDTQNTRLNVIKYELDKLLVGGL